MEQQNSNSQMLLSLMVTIVLLLSIVGCLLFRV